MSGPFGSSQFMYSSGAGGGFYPLTVDQSLRFNNNDSAYLSRTPSSAGNRKTWTWSGWFKKATNDIQHPLFYNGIDGGAEHGIRFRIDDNSLDFFRYSGGYSYRLRTSALYRDSSAWYHIVAVLDTTQGTASNRAKLYVNGEQITSFQTATYPSQNAEFETNNTVIHRIGNFSTSYLDGYLAEVNFIDGQALDPTSFGEFKSGVWVPKAYSGSYGTNGFHLDFGNSGSLGADTSGNSNNWTTNNLAATDQVLDSPTNNFCTLNPIDKRSGSNVDEANLYIGPVSGNHYWARGTIKIPNDKKIYLEALAGDNGSGSIVAFFGIINQNSNPDSGQMDNGVACNSADFYKHVDGSGSSQGSSVLTAGDIVGLAFDMPNSTMTIYKNGSVTTNAVSFTAGEFYLYLSIFFNFGGTPSWVLNAGQDSSFNGRKTRQGNTDDNGIGDFYYAPPSGYLALCTANLPDPVIDPAQDDSPSDYFNTVLYTGNGTNARSITGVGFQPSLTWIKTRSVVDNHVLHDEVRGANKQLFSNSTDNEFTATTLLQSFDSDGFTIGTDSAVNGSGRTFAAWNWLAGNGTSSNTSGTISSTVSVNQTAGFSIVSYTGTGTSGPVDSVGHGLNSTPEIYFTKRRDATNGWFTFTNAIDGGWDYSFLDTTSAFASTNQYADSSKLYLSGSSTNASGGTYVAYVFHSVEGYSKVGRYSGNSSSDGPFIYLGFRPAWFMLKRTDSTGEWWIYNAKTEPYNVMDTFLQANSSSAEIGPDATSYGIDFVSNGFKHRSGLAAKNLTGGTYIYMAFAEMPFKYSNAR